MPTSNMSMIASVRAAATAVNPLVYSAPVSILALGHIATILFPSAMTLISVSSSLETFSVSFNFLASLSAFATIASSMPLPGTFSPPTAPVLRLFSIPSRLTAIVLLVREMVRIMAPLFNGLMASRGTSFSISLPLSSYKSTLSLYFAILYLLFNSSVPSSRFSIDLEKTGTPCGLDNVKLEYKLDDGWIIHPC